MNALPKFFFRLDGAGLGYAVVSPVWGQIGRVRRRHQWVHGYDPEGWIASRAGVDVGTAPTRQKAAALLQQEPAR